MISLFRKAASLLLVVFLFSFFHAFAQEANIVGPSKLKAINIVRTEITKRYCSNPNNCPQLTPAQKAEIKLEINWFSQMASQEADKITSEPTGTAQEKTAFGSQFIVNLYDNFINYLNDRKNTLPENSTDIANIVDTSLQVISIQKQIETDIIKLNTGQITAQEQGKNATNLQQSKRAIQGDPDPTGCSLTNLNPTTCIDGVVAWFIRVTLVNAALGVFYITGLFLHFTLYFGLVSMNGLVTQGIYDLWLFTRNLIFAGVIFSTLYFIGMYLVGLGHSIARASVAVILFALFSGFSFSATTGLIDVSNMITSSLYNNISPNWMSSTSWENPTIATEFMSRMGYSTYSNLFTGEEKNSIVGSAGGSKVAINLLLAATMIYNSFILLMMGILFMFRDLGLIGCIIFSPLLLIDQAIPKLGDAAKWFRRFFLGQLAIGPVFMVLISISLKVTDVVASGVKTAGVSGSNFGLVFFNLVAITAIFHFTYKACKKLSGILGEVALGALGSVASKAMIATPLGLAGRTAAFVGRNTAGRAGQALADRMQNSDARNGYFGNKIYGAAKYAGYGATYDFNNSSVIANAKSNFAQKTGFNPQGGYVETGKSYVDAKEIATQNFRKDLRSFDDMENPEQRKMAIDKRASGNYLRGKFGTGKLDPNDKTPAWRRTSTMSDKEKLAEVKRVSGFTKESKTEFADSVEELNLEHLSTQTPVQLTATKAKLDELIKKANQSGGDTEKWFMDFLKKKLLHNILDDIKTSTTLPENDPKYLNPLDPKFSEKAKARIDTHVQTVGSILQGDTVALKNLEDEVKNISLQKKRADNEEAKVDKVFNEREDKRKEFNKLMARNLSFIDNFKIPTSMNNLETRSINNPSSDRESHLPTTATLNPVPAQNPVPVSTTAQTAFRGVPISRPPQQPPASSSNPTPQPVPTNPNNGNQGASAPINQRQAEAV